MHRVSRESVELQRSLTSAHARSVSLSHPPPHARHMIPDSQKKWRHSRVAIFASVPAAYFGGIEIAGCPAAFRFAFSAANPAPFSAFHFLNTSAEPVRAFVTAST